MDLSLVLIGGGQTASMIKGDVAEADVAIPHRILACYDAKFVTCFFGIFEIYPSFAGDRRKIHIKKLIISLSLSTTRNISKSTTLVVCSSTIWLCETYLLAVRMF